MVSAALRLLVLSLSKDERPQKGAGRSLGGHSEITPHLEVGACQSWQRLSQGSNQRGHKPTPLRAHAPFYSRQKSLSCL